MAKKITILLLLVGGLLRADLTREEAKVIMMSVAGKGAIDREIAVYLTMNPLAAGAEVEPFLNEGDPVKLTAATWFGWIDDEPSAFFSHRVRFVYIRASDGEVTVVNHEWWPEVDGDPPFAEQEIKAKPDLVLLSSRHEVDP